MTEKCYFDRYARKIASEEEFRNSTAKSKKGKKVGKKLRTKLIVENIKPIKRQPKKTTSKNVNESPGEDEWCCLICVEPYSIAELVRGGSNVCHVTIGLMKNVPPPPGKNFICQNCNSDDEYI